LIRNVLFGQDNPCPVGVGSGVARVEFHADDLLIPCLLPSLTGLGNLTEIVQSVQDVQPRPFTPGCAGFKAAPFKSLEIGDFRSENGLSGARRLNNLNGLNYRLPRRSCSPSPTRLSANTVTMIASPG
jgi:hypothetical protein